jgi:hypothetical protein
MAAQKEMTPSMRKIVGMPSTKESERMNFLFFRSGIAFSAR